MFGKRHSRPDIGAITRYLEGQGVTLLEGLDSLEGSFGIDHEAFPPALVDANDFFVRFQAIFSLSNDKVLEDPIGALELVNDLNNKLTLVKVTLHRDKSDSTSTLNVVAILPALFDPAKIFDVYGLWQENLSQLVLNDAYDTFVDE